MTESLVAKQSFFVTPPRSSGSAVAASVGEVVSFATSTSATYVNLAALLQQTTTPTTPSQQSAGVTGNFITVYALSSDMYVILGPTAASVSGANVPVVPTVSSGIGSLSAGAYTRAAGTAFPIKSGTALRFFLQHGVDKFMGLVASGTGTCVMYQSSPGNP